MRFSTLQQWLDWQESLHNKEIDLGLERVKKVAQDLFSFTDFPVIISVAGTNGKGSVCGFLSSIYTQAGYKVGLYSSPHILRYNERIRINNQDVSDEQICEAFERVDLARKDTSLTYFEFGTLAALDVFHRAELDVIILEVGLGGRLDAVNIIDPDVAIISSIDLDHQAWLGNDRESIAREKLGICRSNTPLVVGELDPPEVIEQYCRKHKIPLYLIRREFAYQTNEQQWLWDDGKTKLHALPKPALLGDHQFLNASVAIMATQLLRKDLPVAISELKKGLIAVELSGRVQRIQDGNNHIIIDVAHNPQSVRALRSSLQKIPVAGDRIAILGMLSDKDIEGSLEQPIVNLIDHWMLVGLSSPRAAEPSHLKEVLLSKGVSENQIATFPNVDSAYTHYKSESHTDDLLVIFGSFFTASEAMSLIN